MLDLQSVYFGQKHKDFDNKDFDLIKKISRLEKKHKRQCENSCNGEGYVNNKFYTFHMKEVYIDNETTVFDKEIRDIENKIEALIDKENVHPIVKSYRVEFQHDPRGATVKLYYENDYIEL